MSTHKTLADAIRAGVPDGQRVYKAVLPSQPAAFKEVFVVSNSPKAAAEAIVKPVAVSQKDMLAAYKAMVEKPEPTGKGE